MSDQIIFCWLLTSDSILFSAVCILQFTGVGERRKEDFFKVVWMSITSPKQEFKDVRSLCAKMHIYSIVLYCGLVFLLLLGFRFVLFCYVRLNFTWSFNFFCMYNLNLSLSRETLCFLLLEHLLSLNV